MQRGKALDLAAASAKACRVRRLEPRDFHPAVPPQPLADDEIHLWFFPQWPALPAAESAPLRRVLAGYLGRPAEVLRLARARGGKPALVDAPLEFSLAHSRGALLLGLSRGQPLGVDLELPHRARPVLELARRWFAPAEARALARLPEARRPQGFLAMWSLKEAVLKAEGTGLGGGLARVAVTLDAAGVPIAAGVTDADPATAWRCVYLAPPAAGAVGALAWRGAERSVRAFLAPSIPPAVARPIQSG